MRLNGRLAGAVAVLALLGAVASGCSSSSTSNGGTSATSGSPSTKAPSHDAGTAPTLAALTSSVQAQITGTGSNDFSVTGLTKLICNLPAAWTVNATFKCFGYDFANDEIGEYDATVQAESGHLPQWSGQWTPK